MAKQIRPLPWYQSSPEPRDNKHVTVPIAFEIIVHHFSDGKTILSKQDIDDRVLEAHEAQNGIPEFDETDPVSTVLHALKRFGFAEDIGRDQWRIKSVDDMCARLHALPEPKVNTRVTVPIAFEIIVHHFSGNTVLLKKAEINSRVLSVHEAQNGIPEFDETDPVNRVLYNLKRFGFAENYTDHGHHGYWRIKSVDDMCARLHALVHNRNIGDEGEDF